MKINNNSQSATALNTLNFQEKIKDTLLKQIASGQVISQTDGASQTLYDNLTSNASALTQGIQNGNDAVGYMQIADASLQSVNNGAQKLNVLSVALNNAGLNSSDKTIIQTQAQNIQSTMSNAVNNANFNGKSVFGNANFNVGSQNIGINIQKPDLASIDINNQDSIVKFISNTDQMRASIGSTINATSSAITNNLSMVNSQQASASQIGDTDYASASTELNTQMLKTNAATFALAHNNTYLAQQAARLLA